jgi:hypothetical protein
MNLSAEKVRPDASNIAGTYEEMYSNWHGKMAEAHERNDVFASFMNLAWFQGMLQGIGVEVAIPQYHILDKFDPVHLERNTALFDDTLALYETVYHQVGMQPVRYRDIDAFLQTYMQYGADA